MAEFNQSAATVERARAYLADVKAGHVSFADESAPFLALTGHLGALLEVIDGTGSTRTVRAAARAVLAELPDAGLLRCDGEVEQSPSFWIARLQDAVRELLGSTAARLAALEDAERDALRQALTDAIGVRAAAAAQSCPDCVVHPMGLDYSIAPGQACGLRSSLNDHLGRLPASALLARRPDGADPA